MEFTPEEIDELRRYIKGAVARICPRRLSDQVEDLTHEALLRVIDVARRRKSPVGFSRGYYWRVAYTHVVDAVRRIPDAARWDGYLDRAGDPATGDPDPEESLSLQELGRAIWGCLEKLARDRRHAIVLMLMGHHNREIAEVTGWSSKKAENNVTRGRENLRDCLRKLGYEA